MKIFLKKTINKVSFLFKNFILNKFYKCKIQNNCQIAFNTTVKNSILEGQNKVGNFSKIETSKLGHYTYCGEFCRLQNVDIGRFVSIGSNVTVLPVSICDHVVIGAGAVVTKDIIEPGTYVGNPARKLK